MLGEVGEVLVDVGTILGRGHPEASGQVVDLSVDVVEGLVGLVGVVGVAQVADRVREVTRIALRTHLLTAARGEERHACHGGEAYEDRSGHGDSLRSVHECTARCIERTWNAVATSLIPWNIAPMPIQSSRSQAERLV